MRAISGAVTLLLSISGVPAIAQDQKFPFAFVVPGETVTAYDAAPNGLLSFRGGAATEFQQDEILGVQSIQSGPAAFGGIQVWAQVAPVNPETGAIAADSESTWLRLNGGAPVQTFVPEDSMLHDQPDWSQALPDDWSASTQSVIDAYIQRLHVEGQI